MLKFSPFILFVIMIAMSCKQKQKADLIVRNGKIYSLDSNLKVYECLAVRDGKIISLGTNEQILEKFSSSKIIDAEGKFIFPGFNDAHCHFYGYGKSLERVNLVGTENFDSVVKRVEEFAKNCKSEWIIGRGWDQNDWEVKNFPSNEQLNTLFPDRPVLLYRIDGHAALANNEALKRAGITGSSTVEGGRIIILNNIPTGILIDNAIDLVLKVIPQTSKDEMIRYLLLAQQNCFSVGITSLSDAGLDLRTINTISEIQNQGKLKIRINAMLEPSDEAEKYIQSGKSIQTDLLRCKSIKLYADGALGSRGACLLEKYSDDDGKGTIISSIDFYRKWIDLAFKNNYQVCTHCIGDSANRMMLNLYGETLKKANDFRWRIEHAQVINPADFPKFKTYSIIPSVQPTHATSDMYWAENRIGPERIKGAYAYKTLLNQNKWLVNGSDFPVEEINPIFGFYAAVSRKDKKGYPQGGFLATEKLSRIEALKAMTIWAAKGSFEENIKGSLETGKFADFVVLDKDLMTCPESEIFKIKVLMTFVNGEKVF